MSSATVEERARKKAERKLEKQRQAAQHDCLAPCDRPRP